MRKLRATLLTVLLLVSASYTHAQEERADTGRPFCRFNAAEASSVRIATSPPEQKMVELVKEILTYTGLPQNFDVKVYDGFNMEARVIDKQRYLLYNPEFLRSVDENVSSYWVVIGIVAHETAHHLLGHTIEHEVTSKEQELEADRFVGFIMYRGGVGFASAKSRFDELLTKIVKPNVTQASKEERLNALEDGWNEAQKFSSWETQPVGPPLPGESKSWVTIRRATVKAAVYQRFWQNVKTNLKMSYEAAKEYLKLFTDDDDQTVHYLKRWIAAYESPRNRQPKVIIN